MRPSNVPCPPAGLVLVVLLVSAGAASAETSFYEVSAAALVGKGGGSNGLIGDEMGEDQEGFNSTGSTRLSQLFSNQSALLLELTGPAALHLPGVDPGSLTGTITDFTVQADSVDFGAFVFDLPDGTHEITFAADGTLGFAYTQATCNAETGGRETCPTTFEVDLVGRGYVVAAAVDPSTIPGLAADPIGDLVSYVATLRGFAPAGATVGIMIVDQTLDSGNARGLGFSPTLDGGSLRDVFPFFVAPAGIAGTGLLCDDEDLTVDACTVGDEISVGPGDESYFGHTVFFGESAFGRVTLDGGASLGARGIVLGNDRDVLGQLFARGVGTSVETALLVVAESGQGRLEVTDGAEVDVEDLPERCNENPLDTTPCSTREAFLASGAGAEGLVRVSGAGSRLRVASTGSGDSLKLAQSFVIGAIGEPGAHGYAEIVVEDGGLLESEGAVLASAPDPTGGAEGETAEAWIVVRGAGSRWNTGGRVAIATGSIPGAGATGGIEVLDGGEVQVASAGVALARLLLTTNVGGQATVRVAGAQSRLHFPGPDALIETRSGSSLVEVTDGGRIEGAFFAALGQVGGLHEFNVSGPDSWFGVSGTCSLCTTLADQPALLGIGIGGFTLGFVSDGGVVEIDSLIPPPGAPRGGLFVGGAQLAAGFSTGNGALTVTDAGSQVRILGEEMQIQIGVSGDGILIVDEGGQVTLENPMGASRGIVAPTAGNVGQIVVAGASSLLDSGAVLQIGGAAGETGGIASVEVGAGSTIRASTFELGNGGVLAGGGLLEGTVDAFGGTVAPGAAVLAGDATQTLSVSGDLQVGSGGRVELDVAGLATHDFVSVAGGASVAGVVLVVFDDAYSPVEGDEFVLIGASTPVDFAAATIESSGLPGATGISVDADSEGRLRVTVPEPGAFEAAFVALAMLGVRASRRSRR